MKRYLRNLAALMAAVLLSLPGSALASSGEATSAPGVASASSAAEAAQPAAAPADPAAQPAAPVADAALAEDEAAEMDYPRNIPEVRLTLVERLQLQNAICSLWNTFLMQGSVNAAGIDPFTLNDPPENIFVDPPNNFDYDEEWYFEGLIRRMEPGADGIERIADIHSFLVRFQRQKDGSFRIVSTLFEPLGGAG